MSLPHFFLPSGPAAIAGALVPLEPAQARHLWVLRIGAGSAVELVLPSGAWKGDVAELAKDRAMVRLVRPLTEHREAGFPIRAYVPLTAQLSLLDDILPPLVEMGVSDILPVIYQRSEYDAQKTAARLERWQRIVLSACEQSHRSRLPVLEAPLPFEALLKVEIPRWVAYELPTGASNPRLEPGPVAFTSGPEGGITDGEFKALADAGWAAVSLGGSILRAVTCPVAIMGAIRFQNPA